MPNPTTYPQPGLLKNIVPKDISHNLKKMVIKKPEIKIVFFGTNHLSVIVLQKLLDFCQNSSLHPKGVSVKLIQSPIFSIQSIITQPDKPVGRKQEISPSPVAELAQANNIPVLKPEKLDEGFINNHLSFLEADLFIVAVYGKILPKKLLDIPGLGALNIHPSLLPKYRGPSPIQTALLNGDKISGVTIIQMDEKMDHGPIVITKEIILSEQYNFDTLSKKMFNLGADLLTQIIPQYLKGKLPIRPQNDQAATYTKIIGKEDGFFDISNPPSPKQLDRMIRAYYPWPTAWSRLRQDFGGQARIVKFLPNNMVQLEGKKAVKVEDFLRGHPNFPIKNLQ